MNNQTSEKTAYELLIDAYLTPDPPPDYAGWNAKNDAKMRAEALAEPCAQLVHFEVSEDGDRVTLVFDVPAELRREALAMKRGVQNARGEACQSDPLRRRQDLNYEILAGLETLGIDQNVGG